MTVNYPTTISNLVASQFPAFYRENGPTLVAFLEAYYEWMEQQGNVINQTRNLLSYSDIDTTLEEFVVHFKNTYLQGIQFSTLSDQRLMVKKIIDLYKAKGSERALKLLFQLVFDEDISVYFPGTDILKPSDGIYTQPIYLEVSNSPRISEYLGKLVTGINSGATAFVDKIITRAVGSKFITILYLTNLLKDFETGEGLNINNDLTNIPFVVGSLTNFIVDSGSYGFNIGDIVSVSSLNGQQATGRVTAIEDVSGIVTFTLEDGGWGYTSNSQILISNTILRLTNVHSTALTNTTPIPKFSTVVINNPANNAANTTANVFAFSSTINLYSTPVTGSFIKNEVVTSSDGNAFGIITTPPVVNSTVVALALSNVYNSYFATGQTITGANSGATATVLSYDTDIGIINIQGSVTNAHTALYTSTGNATITGYSTGIDASFNINQLNVTETLYVYSDYIGGQSILQTNSTTTGTFTTGNNIITAMGSTSGIANNSLITSTNGTVSAGLPASAFVYNVINTTAVSMSGAYTGANATGAAVKFTGNTPYTSIALNATSYGFPKLPSANLTNGYLVDIIGAEVLNLGTIESITVTNPGIGYNDNPYVEIYEPTIAPKRKQDYVITLSAPSTGYIIGETVTQVVTVSGVSNVHTSNVNGGTNPANLFSYGEVVYQSNGAAGKFLANTANAIMIATTGTTTSLSAGEYVYIGGTDLRVINNVVNSSAFYLTSAPYTANASANVVTLSAVGTVLLIIGNNFVANMLSGTYVTTLPVTGLSSGTTANVYSVNTAAITQTATGSVTAKSNNILDVRRLSITQDFVPGYSVTGSLSAQSITAVSVVPNTVSAFSGDNANVLSAVFSSAGTVKNLVVESSGFGYVNSELITFTSADGTRSGTAKVVLGKQGYGPGYYSSTKGFLSADKYLQDSYYYQNFSYEIESSLDLFKYVEMVKAVTHVAGTKVFGATIKKSTLSTPLHINNSNTAPTIGT
jgi:hypothetical protein